jgi:hypothetical protein
MCVQPNRTGVLRAYRNLRRSGYKRQEARRITKQIIAGIRERRAGRTPR